MTSAHFVDDLTAALELYDPVLVQLDPLYVYFGDDREAGNVFDTGPAAHDTPRPHPGRALQVAHHFTKAAARRLTLASLTQAGMREAVDHWLLISVDEHDLDRAALRARHGTRCPPRARLVTPSRDRPRPVRRGHLPPRRPNIVHLAGPQRRRIGLAESPSLRRPSNPSRQDTTLNQHHGVTVNWIKGRLKGGGQQQPKLPASKKQSSEARPPHRTGPRGSTLHYYVKDYPQPSPTHSTDSHRFPEPVPLNGPLIPLPGNGTRNQSRHHNTRPTDSASGLASTRSPWVAKTHAEDDVNEAAVVGW